MAGAWSEGGRKRSEALVLESSYEWAGPSCTCLSLLPFHPREPPNGTAMEAWIVESVLGILPRTQWEEEKARHISPPQWRPLYKFRTHLSHKRIRSHHIIRDGPPATPPLAPRPTLEPDYLFNHKVHCCTERAQGNCCTEISLGLTDVWMLSVLGWFLQHQAD